ncbi:MAG TPA: hypothetical protein P5191_13055 [Ruminococcus sp.]|nr:hypothetical protein [Ruminococcus sp.]
MSKLSELDAVITELTNCGKAIITAAETLREIFSSDDPQVRADQEAFERGEIVEIYNPETDEQPVAPQPTLEELRAVLSGFVNEGFSSTIHDILEAHGAKKLKTLAPEHYAAVMREAKEKCRR